VRLCSFTVMGCHSGGHLSGATFEGRSNVALLVLVEPWELRLISCMHRDGMQYMCANGPFAWNSQDQSTELAETPGSRFAADCGMLIAEGQLPELLSRLLSQSDLVFSKAADKGQLLIYVCIPWQSLAFLATMLQTHLTSSTQTWSVASTSSAIWWRGCQPRQERQRLSRSRSPSQQRCASRLLQWPSASAEWQKPA
jgi:hypothetical protein